MIIDLKSVPRESPKHLEFQLHEDWWRSDELSDSQILGLYGALRVNIDIYRAGGKYILEGYLDGSIRVSCSRCLKPFPFKVTSDFRTIITEPPSDVKEPEIELMEEDMEVFFLRDDEIDLDEIIREQLYLSLPIKSLFREDCLGLCPVCGNDLNEGECLCKRGSGHPGFSKLKDITFT